MKTLTKAQFIAWLEKWRACPGAIQWARKQKTARDILEKCWCDNWLLWLIERVRGPAWAELQRARAEYERVRGLARAEYELGWYSASFEGPALRRALTWERVVKAVKP